MSTILSDWKERAANARKEWASHYWAELEAQIRQWLSQNEISDEAFMSVMEVCIPQPHYTGTGSSFSSIEQFSREAGLDKGMLDSWFRYKELPPADMRAAYVHICLGAARSKSLIERVDKLISSRESLPEIFFPSVVTELQVEEPAIAEVSAQALASSSDTNKLLFDPWKKVEDLYLSVRSENTLKKLHIKFLGELVQKDESELSIPRYFGPKSLEEVRFILRAEGAYLGMKHSLLDQFNEELGKKREAGEL